MDLQRRVSLFKFNKKIAATGLLFLLLAVMTFAAYAAEPAKPTKENPALIQFLQNLFKRIEFTTAIKTEYDDNIFLTPTNEKSDVISTVTQGMCLKVPEDPFYLQLDYTGNLSYYWNQGDKLYDHLANFIASYRPTKNFSYGISNSFKKMINKKITTTLGDQLLSMGYTEDTPVFEMKYQPTEKLTIDYMYQHYYLRAARVDDNFINRDDNVSNVAFTYDFYPDLAAFVGFNYRDANFPADTVKDGEIAKGFYGITKKFPGFCNVTVSAAHDSDQLLNRHDTNTEANLSVNSTFSAYTILNLAYHYNNRIPSARAEYSQYFDDAVELGLTQLLDLKTTLTATVGYERQHFYSSDVVGTNPVVDKHTDIISLETLLKRKLNSWLDLDLTYNYSKRNTKFAAEGYTENRVGLGLVATF